jgi:GH43 family beta-xylosidase
VLVLDNRLFNKQPPVTPQNNQCQKPRRRGFWHSVSPLDIPEPLIDADVFTDPQTAKNYLYWANGYMACAELNDDMISLKKGTTKILTPCKYYNEGTYVVYRKGIYYFMWPQNDTRSPDYAVHYGTSDSPLGPLKAPVNNTVIAKNAKEGTYGTGHNSVIQIPGRDEWYIVYHRFNYSKGISVGYAADYNREVCIDKLEFNNDGNIKGSTYP